jgi:hypothetical protein
MTAWRNALIEARQELLGEPYDPERDCTMAEACELLSMGNGATTKYLTAHGWQPRMAKLPNGHWSRVWRAPD